MKKYYLYNKMIKSPKGDWTFDDEFIDYITALHQAKENAKNSSWKIWKIEEVWDFS